MTIISTEGEEYNIEIVGGTHRLQAYRAIIENRIKEQNDESKQNESKQNESK